MPPSPFPPNGLILREVTCAVVVMAADRRLLPDRGLLTARLTLLPLLALIIHPPPQYLLETISFSYGQIGRGGIGPQLFEVLIILTLGGSQKIKARFFAISEAISESCLSHQKLMFFLEQ